MQLLCNGVALDLKSGATLSFKKVNPLFAFDSLTCERTQAFTIPATPHNERVFGLAKIPAFNGEGMRRRFACELQDGTVVKTGYLYVDKYSAGNYNAVFVTGELVGLQDIKNLGKLSEVLQADETLQWSYGNVPALPQRATDTWNVVAYTQNGEFVHPSMLIDALVQKAVTQRSLAPITLPADAQKLRIVCAKPQLLQLCTIDVARSKTTGWVEGTAQYVVGNTIGVSSDAPAISALFDTDTSKTITYKRHWEDFDFQTMQPIKRTVGYYAKVAQLVAKQPLSITFPATWPTDAYMVKFTVGTVYTTAVEFYGEREFDKSWSGGQSGHAVTSRTGEPLAGRTVELQAGDVFTFVREADLLDYTYYTEDTTTSETWEQGWKCANACNVSFDAEGNGDAVVGHVLRLQDNLPAITLVELLKAVAAATASVLNYTEGEGVTFDEVEMDTWEVLNVTGSVQAESDMSRTFGTYQQRNVVEYDSDATVPDAQRIRTAYEIDSDNLETEKTLQTLPFSEGCNTVVGGYETLLLEAENEKDTLADANTAATKMVRVVLQPNAGVQQLCDMSTSLTIKIRMTLAQYERIRAKTAILYNGTKYAWTEATWSNSICTAKISKIA